MIIITLGVCVHRINRLMEQLRWPPASGRNSNWPNDRKKCEKSLKRRSWKYAQKEKDGDIRKIDRCFVELRCWHSSRWLVRVMMTADNIVLQCCPCRLASNWHAAANFARLIFVPPHTPWVYSLHYTQMECFILTMQHKEDAQNLEADQTRLPRYALRIPSL